MNTIEKQTLTALVVDLREIADKCSQVSRRHAGAPSGSPERLESQQQAAYAYARNSSAKMLENALKGFDDTP